MIQTILAMSTFPAAVLWLPSPHGAAQGNRNKVAAEERRELSSAEQQLCKAWGATEPAHEQPTSGWAHTGAGSSMKSKVEPALPFSQRSVLQQLLFRCWVSSPGTTRHLTTPANTFCPPSLCSTITLQLFFPCTQF